MQPPIIFVSVDGTGDFNVSKTDIASNNCQNAINAALKKINEDSRYTTVYLKAGTYTISKRIEMYSNTILRGDTKAIIKLKSKAGWDKVDGAQYNNDSNHLGVPLIGVAGNYLGSISNVRISGFEIDGNHDGNFDPNSDVHNQPDPYRSKGSGNYNMIHFEIATNVTVDNMYMHDSHGDGLRVNHCSNIKFYNNKIYKLGHDGLYALDGDNVHGYNNDIVPRTNSALRFNDTSGSLYNNYIHGFKAWDAGNPGIQIQRGAKSKVTVDIYHNKIESTYGAGIWCVGEFTGLTSDDGSLIKIHHNVIKECGNNYSIPYVGGVIVNGLHGVEVVNNTFIKNINTNIGCIGMTNSSVSAVKNVKVIAKNNIYYGASRKAIDVNGQMDNSTGQHLVVKLDSHEIVSTYSCFYYGNGSTLGNVTNLTGNFSKDPLFADMTNGDYHLKSKGGRLDKNYNWVVDEDDSPCISKGDPASDCSLEPPVHGQYINIGNYGGTPQADRAAAPDQLTEAQLAGGPGTYYAPEKTYETEPVDDGAEEKEDDTEPTEEEKTTTSSDPKSAPSAEPPSKDISTPTSARGTIHHVGPGQAYNGTDATTINRAIAAASAGDTVYLHAATYEIVGAHIEMKAGILFIGSGSGSCTIRADANSGGKIAVKGTFDGVIRCRNASNAEIAGFTFTSTATSHSDGGHGDQRHGIFVDGGSNIKIHDVYFKKRMYNDAINLHNCSAHIYNCIMNTSCHDGVQILGGCSNVVVENCWIGIELNCGVRFYSSTNSIAKYCTFDGNEGGWNVIELQGDESNNTVDHCIIRNMDFDVFGYKDKPINVTNCVMYNCGSYSPATSSGGNKLDANSTTDWTGQGYGYGVGGNVLRTSMSVGASNLEFGASEDADIVYTEDGYSSESDSEFDNVVEQPLATTYATTFIVTQDLSKKGKPGYYYVSADVKDAQVAINAAIRDAGEIALASRPMTVYIKKGTYYISDHIWLTPSKYACNNVKIQGESGTIIKLAGGLNPEDWGKYKSKGKDCYGMFYIVNAANIKFSTLEIDGSYDDLYINAGCRYGQSHFNMFTIVDSDDIKFEYLTLRNGANDAFLCYRTDNITIDSCLIENAGHDAVQCYYGRNTQVHNCRIGIRGGAGVRIAGKSNNCEVYNNEFWTSSGGLSAVLVEDSAASLLVHHNYFHNCNGGNRYGAIGGLNKPAIGVGHEYYDNLFVNCTYATNDCIPDTAQVYNNIISGCKTGNIGVFSNNCAGTLNIYEKHGFDRMGNTYWKVVAGPQYITMKGLKIGIEE